jgi:hypothetical protein
MQMCCRRGHLTYLRNRGLLRGTRDAAGFDFWRMARMAAAGVRGLPAAAGAQCFAGHECAQHEKNERERRPEPLHKAIVGLLRLRNGSVWFQ